MRIPLTFCAIFVWTSLNAFAADVVTSQPASASDLSTPLAAVTTYFHAVDRGDVAVAKDASIHDAKNETFIEGVIAESEAQQAYRDAAVKAFGSAAAADQRLSNLGSSKMVIDLATKSSVHIKGDVADLGETGDFPCREVDGKWHLDLVRQNADLKVIDQTIAYLTASAKNYNDFASQLSAGKWKSLEDAEKARNAAAPQPPPPPDAP